MEYAHEQAERPDQLLPWCVALTGGIGSGKSTVARLFVEQGAGLVDTDALAHALTAPGGAALPALVAAFGPTILTDSGSMDRAAMRQRIFSDPSAKATLEGILHPLIRAETSRQCMALSATVPYVLVDIPLLVETGFFRRYCQRVLVVDCPESLQKSRVHQRNGFSTAEIDAIMARQASRAQRLAVADDVLSNDGDLVALSLRVNHLHQTYVQAAGRFSA